jgi:spore coat polysaccharide biosynthesis predicted glycosyltransferase SpsG
MQNIKKQIFFRVDVTEKSGLGHFYRCLAYAQILDTEITKSFSFSVEIEQVMQIIKQQKFPFQIIEDDFEFVNSLEAESVVILDGYNYSSKLQKYIVDNSHYLIVIDDFTDKTFYANSIINSSPYVRKENYQLAINSKLYLGLEYMIIRPSFFEDRDNYYFKKSNLWIIGFGGTSRVDLYIKYIKFLNDFNLQQLQVCTELYVILNDSDLDKNIINEYLKSNLISFKVSIFQRLESDKIIQLMDEAKYGIFPGSGLLREALLRNVFCMTGFFVDNQVQISTFFDEEGVAVSLKNMCQAGFDDFKKCTTVLRNFDNNVYKRLNNLLSKKQKDNLKNVIQEAFL